jgi:hypothetical protein
MKTKPTLVLVLAVVVSFYSTVSANPDRTVPRSLAFDAPANSDYVHAEPSGLSVSRTWKTIDYTAIAVSTAALVADWGQTACTASKGWGFTHEVNPLMGSARPSVFAVTAYSATVVALNVLAWKLLPEKWRSVIPASVIAVQSYAVLSNLTNRWVPSGCPKL